MPRNVIAVTGVAALFGLTLACTSNSSTPLTPTTPASTGTATAAADGSTLKASAPVPQSPVGGVKPATGPATLVVSPAVASFSAAALPPQYRFQIFNSANTMVADVLAKSTTYPVDAQLTVNQAYTWKARAELNGYVGPWSATASFIAPESAFLGVNTFADPLTNGRTVGQQRGGTFVPGGWQAQSLFDGIDYDLQATCVDCRLEFDATNFGPQEGLPFEKDVKWVSMGDANAFGGFSAFRDHPWKMHLVQRADFARGMEIIWRNGGTDADGGDPGDHRIKLIDTPITFRSSDVYHFQLDWGFYGYSIAVNGITVLEDGWDHWYEPPNFRVSLGCYPRGETMIGIIYRNVKLTKH
jgi:hypothetical protein